MALSRTTLLLLCLAVLLLLLPRGTHAFGAGNIASISRIEGRNWRHGDIEDILSTLPYLPHRKWTSALIKRVYFGNWLRDYSQAVDVGTLKGVQANTIRILVWVLSFMSFGYATGEFEVTEERLGVYRPEEHIDNPRDYADNVDARQLDPRLRGPVGQEELAVDQETGMKNYIANERGGWATSSGYVKHSLARSIHFGRVYLHGHQKGREEDLYEAMRCLGQALHCLEDFGAHTNYTELALREMGFSNVFPHVGVSTQMNVRGKMVFPLVTGTFGGVDFLHSVLGEASDNIAQSEIDEMNTALGNAANNNKKDAAGGGNSFVDLLGRVPGMGGLVQEAFSLQAASDAQAQSNAHGGQRGFDGGFESSRASVPGGPGAYGAPQGFAAPPGSAGGPPGPGIPGYNMNTDPQTIVAKIYPILVFRDKVVRSISDVISKIPGLENLIEKITERLTIFIMSLLAPFIQPIITTVSKQLKEGSSSVIDASGRHQYEPWTDPHCTDPTHSLLSKDHFSNILNEPAGQVAAEIVKYVAPRITYAWQHPDVAVQQVLDDVVRVFHHPAMRDQHLELHRNMFAIVEKWAHRQPNRGASLNDILSSQSVREGKNHIGGVNPHTSGQPHSHSHGGHSQGHGHGHGQHGGGYQDYLLAPGQREINPYSTATPPPQSAPYGAPAPYDASASVPQQQYDYNAPPPMAAGPVPGDQYAYPTAYQQGWETGYQGPPAGGYDQGAPPGQGVYDPNAPLGGYGREGFHDQSSGLPPASGGSFFNS